MVRWHNLQKIQGKRPLLRLLFGYFCLFSILSIAFFAPSPSMAAEGAESGQAEPAPSPISPEAKDTPDPQKSPEAPSPILRYLGRPVVDARVEIDGYYRLDDLDPLLELPSGITLNPFILDRNIQLLYQIGDIENIVVEVKALPSGVALIFHIVPQPVAAAIEFQGNRLISERALARISRIRSGEAYKPEDLDRVRANIKREYVDEGYSRARITVEEIPTAKGDMRILFKINEGEPERIDKLEFQGISRDEAAALQNVIRHRVGSRYVFDALEEDRRRILDFYRNRGHLAATVEMDPQLFANNRRVIRYRIESGPQIQLDFYQVGTPATGPLRGYFRRNLVEVLGTNRRLLRRSARDRLVSRLDLENERRFSTGFMEESRDIITAYYRSQGYDDVRILVRDATEPGDKVRRFVFTVRLGDVMPVDRIEVEGNSKVSDALFSDLVLEALAEGAPWGLYTEDAFNAVKGRVLDYYRGNGFQAAYFESIEAHEEDGLLGPKMVISARIIEGKQRVIEAIEFRGVRAESETDLRALLKIEAEQPYNLAKVRASEAAFKAYYHDKGRIAMRMAPTQLKEVDGQLILQFTIIEGSVFTFGNTIVEGNRFTRDRVIERQLSIEPGQIYQPLRLDEMQRDLMSTGVFRGVEIRPLIGENAQHDLLVLVHERNRVELATSVGISLEDWLEAELSLSHNNLWGLGHRVSLNGQIGGMTRGTLGLRDLLSVSQLYARIQASTGSKIELSYQQPYLLGSDFTSTYTLSIFERDIKNNYRISRNAVDWGLSKQLGPRLQGFSLLQWESRGPTIEAVKIVDGEEVLDYGLRSPELAQLWPVDGEQRYGVTGTLGMVFSTRLNQGYGAKQRNFLVSSQLDMIQMFEVVPSDQIIDPAGSQAERVGRISGRATWSEPWVEWLNTEARINAGYAYPFPGSDGAIPVEKRFYLGGATTVRGFQLDSLGPVVVDQAAFTPLTGYYTTIPTGGNAFLSYTLEFTFPLSVFSTSLEGIDLALFHDGGNVYWTGESKKTFLDQVSSIYDDFTIDEGGAIPSRPEDRCDPIGPPVRLAYGAGLRYQTPVGPLRLDWAYNGDSRCYEPQWQLHFSIGLF